MKPSHTVIIGLGYVGYRIVHEELTEGHRVYGLTRSAESSTRAGANGVTAIAGDLDQPESLMALPLQNALVYYLAPPPQTGIYDTRMTNFLAAASMGPPSALVYISTTGVYGNTQGAWVTETAPVNPLQDRSRRRHHAETQLSSWASKNRSCHTAILRVGGIYGPGKLPLARLQKGEPMVDDPAHPSWVNVVHVDDLVTTCRTAARKGPPFAIYNVCDGHPITMMAYFQTIAKLTGLPPPHPVSLEDGKQQLSPEMYSYVAESRRIDTTKLQTELAPSLRYTNLSDGILAALQEEARKKTS